MKKSVLSALISISLLSCFSTHAFGSEIVGYGIISDTGTGDQVSIFNGTGPVNGCSTSAGFPICTSSLFTAATLSVNGGVPVALGDIGASGFTSSTFAYGSLTSVVFQATFSPLSVIDDGGNHLVVTDPLISADIPLPDTDTGLASPALLTIEVSAATTAVPEPSYQFAVGFVLFTSYFAWIGLRRRWVQTKHLA